MRCPHTPQPLGHNSCPAYLPSITYQFYFCVSFGKDQLFLYLYMNDQSFKRKEGTKIPNKIELPLLCITLILAFALQWYVLMVMIAFKICMNISDRLTKQRNDKVSDAIHQFHWYKLHQSLRDSLELLKCRKMVERGYDSRSNTNIILQEEKIQQLTFILTKKQAQIASKIIQIVQLMIRLRQIKRKMFEQQDEDDEKGENVSKVESFRELFTIRKEVDHLLDEIYNFASLYEVRMRQPLLDVSAKLQLVKKCDKLILPILQKITTSFHCLQQLLQSEVNNMSLNSEWQRYLQILMSEQHDQTGLALLIGKINHIQNQIASKTIEDTTNNQSIELIQGSQQHSNTTATQHHHLPEHSPLERRQFMKKLDCLLMVGLARKRQEQFQRKMKLLQEQEAVT